MKKLTAALLLSLAFTSIAMPAEAVTYKNCAAINKDFPGGVSKSKIVKNKGGETKLAPTVNPKIYNQVFRKLDRDRDGIACEK